MAAVIALGLAVLREGLALRAARMRKQPRNSRRHRGLAKLFVPLVALGFASGLVSMTLIRHREFLGSVHGITAIAVLLASGGAGCLGLALERGRALERRDAHALLGAASVLLTLGAALAGMSLLP
jgi:hypothetical protein